MKSTEICGECNGTGWCEIGEIPEAIYGPCDACDAIGPLPTKQPEAVADASDVEVERIRQACIKAEHDVTWRGVHPPPPKWADVETLLAALDRCHPKYSL